MNTREDRQVWRAWQAETKTAATRPWLAALLLHKENQLFARFAHIYRQLLAAPRKVRRQLGAGLATAALLLALSNSPAHAATITVGGGCTLVQAIQSANTDASVGSCTAGSGADTIVLAGGTYNYTTIYSGSNALPTITSTITIEGNGATIARVAGSPDFRLVGINIAGNLTLNNSTITGGKASSGGGINVNYGTLTLNNSTISNNEAPVGGGIYTRGSLTLNNVIVTNNTATNGGGIMARSGATLIINDSTISNNTASDGSFGTGGGLDMDGGNITINRTTISGNTAFSRSGGFEVDSASILILNNSTVSGNTATIGGGLSNYGTATLNNNTIVGNSATQPVAGAGGILQVSGSMTLNRNIVAGNTAPVRIEIYRAGGTMNANNRNVLGHSGLTNAQAFSGFAPGASDITATSDGTTPTALSSILNTTLADNGGPTLTHALVTGSPAIDIIALDGSVCILDTSTDQRGAVRGSGANRGDGACDAGAYEFSSSQTPTAVTNLLTQTTSQTPTSILALLATLLAAFSGVRLWRRR